jgi:hypothetical protein
MATGLHDRLGIGSPEVAPTGDQQRLERVDLASDRREGNDGILANRPRPEADSLPRRLRTKPVKLAMGLGYVRLRRENQPTSAPSTSPTSGAKGTSLITLTTMPSTKPTTAPSAITAPTLMATSLRSRHR